MTTQTGTVKFFSIKRGYGFIIPDDPKEEGEQIFVHHNAIQGDGFKSLADGEPVEFEVRKDKTTGKLCAHDVRGPEGASVKGHTFRNKGKGKGKGDKDDRPPTKGGSSKGGGKGKSKDSGKGKSGGKDKGGYSKGYDGGMKGYGGYGSKGYSSYKGYDAYDDYDEYGGYGMGYKGKGYSKGPSYGKMGGKPMYGGGSYKGKSDYDDYYDGYGKGSMKGKSMMKGKSYREPPSMYPALKGSKGGKDSYGKGGKDSFRDKGGYGKGGYGKGGYY